MKIDSWIESGTSFKKRAKRYSMHWRNIDRKRSQSNI